MIIPQQAVELLVGICRKASAFCQQSDRVLPHLVLFFAG